MRAMISKMGLAITMLAVFCVGIASAGEVVRMRAKLRSESPAFAVGGAAKWVELGPQHKKFSVEVEGFVPGSEVKILVNGNTVGVLKINELGTGELNYDTRIHPGDEDWQPFPLGFPDIQLGDVVTAGQMTGTMQGR